jgi:hypothetical protein
MKNTSLFTTLLLLSGAAVSFGAHAGQANATCSYSHTLGDEAIMMFGKPGKAMWHDFFGNTHTDAFSSYATLRAQPDTTCDDLADASAYWVPSLRLPNGEVVKPAYQKTYYQSADDATNPMKPFPPGLELLAGDHHGTGPSDHIDFFCQDGNGYSNKAGEVCHVRNKGDAVQFNVGIRFPNCWDGVNLKPVHGKMNAAYSVNNTCPADFPVKIPTVNLNAVWVLPQITSLDTAKVLFSMDPIMHGDQREDQWGSVYTAHADFMNGWTEDGARFMTDLCMNNGMDCGGNVPWGYSTPSDDTWVSSEAPTENHGRESSVVLKDGSTMALVKFKIPPLPQKMPAEQLANFKYSIRTFGGKDESGASRIYFYMTDSDNWQQDTATWNNRPGKAKNAFANLYLDEVKQYRYVDVNDAVRQALAEGKSELSFYISGDGYGHTFRFNSSESKENMVLMLTGHVKVPEV